MHINFAQVYIQELGYCQSCDMLGKKTFVQISLAIFTNIFGNLAKDKLDTHMCAATEVYRSWRAEILLKF